MQDTPKEKPDESTEPQDSNWSDDQRERSYYYDDSHGYKTFDEKDDLFAEEHEAKKAEREGEEDDADEGADLSGGAFNVDLD